MNQNHLTKGDAIPLPFDALELLAQYAAQTNAVNTGVEDEFLFAANHFLTNELFKDENLHPANWLVDRPRLSLFALVTPKNTFALEVGPWREAMHDVQVRGKTAIGLDDFAKFSIPEYSRKYPRTRVLELPLDAIAFHLDQPAPTPNLMQAFRLQRRTVNAMYEFAVQRLSTTFQCQLQDLLVCYGPESYLAIRHVSSLENPVERLDVPADEQDTWHPEFAALCQKAGTTVKDITAFWSRDLVSLPPAQRPAVLIEFLGGHDNTVAVAKDLVGVLNVVTNPEAYPPLTAQNTASVQWAFDRLIPRGSHSLAKLAAAYHMSETSALALVRELDLDRYDAMNHPPKTLVNELRAMPDDGKAAPRRHVAYQEKLIGALSSLLSTRRGAYLRRGAQLADVARAAGFNHPRAFVSFLEKKAPMAADWLSKSNAAYRTNRDQDETKPVE